MNAEGTHGHGSEVAPIPSPKRVELGSHGLAFVRQSLARGLMLSRELDAAADWTLGSVYTIVPDLTPLEVSRDLGRSRVMPEAWGTEQLVTCVGRAVSEPKRTLVVAENQMARASDPSLAADSETVFTSGEDVYEYVASITRDHITRLVRLVDASYQLNLFVFTPEPEVSLPSRGDAMSLHDLIHLSRWVRLIAVRAFDGEGFVYWEPSPAAGGATPDTCSCGFPAHP